MNYQKNKDIKSLNTFGVPCIATNFFEINTSEDIDSISEIYSYKDIFILGGGSNILFTKDLDKTVLKINIKGKEILEEKENNVTVKTWAGEIWHDFVMWCVERDFGGLENLSLIPGSVGACPVQNIGAYGVEVKDVIEEVNVFDLKEKKQKKLLNEECNFDYRNSIFKEHKGRYLILNVVFNLTKKIHNINISYGSIKDMLNTRYPTLRDISTAVIEIRKNKLPDPNILGNVGSFFRNPSISKDKFELLKSEFQNIKGYEQNDGKIKISAGWLIEKCDLKGQKFGNCGVYDKQALILVNYGGATGKEILETSQKIQNIVFQKFDIHIYPEVNII